jgi:hypothetical protein
MQKKKDYECYSQRHVSPPQLACACPLAPITHGMLYTYVTGPVRALDSGSAMYAVLTVSPGAPCHGRTASCNRRYENRAKQAREKRRTTTVAVNFSGVTLTLVKRVRDAGMILLGSPKNAHLKAHTGLKYA